jgi:uncharacterized protein YxjI
MNPATQHTSASIPATISAHTGSPPTLALYPQHVARQPEQIILAEKGISLSGDSFSVKTASGIDVFVVKGEAFSLSGRKHISDAAGVHLFDLRKEHLQIHSTYYCEDPAGKRILEVKSKFSIGKSKAFGSFTNASDGRQVELTMQGNFFDTQANIVESATGQVVATIERNAFKMKDVFANKQTYVVNVQPGVDLVLIAALCICFDEKNNEKK